LRGVRSRGCEDDLVARVLSPPVTAAALADASAAVAEYEGAVAWFADQMDRYEEPLAVEVWVLDPSLARVLLVEHRWRGWVPPGGKAEPGEVPRVAAARELLEETGLTVDLLRRPAAVMARSYHPDWPLTLGLTYAAIADPSAPLVAEPAQSVAWKSLDEPWTSSFPDDIERIRSYVAWAATASS
jgi:8-oxo-dGTP diphosphatase